MRAIDFLVNVHLCPPSRSSYIHNLSLLGDDARFCVDLSPVCRPFFDRILSYLEHDPALSRFNFCHHVGPATAGAGPAIAGVAHSPLPSNVSTVVHYSLKILFDAFCE